MSEFIMVYRGAKSPALKNKNVWVTPDEWYAKEYGEVTKYLIPTDLNLLDINGEDAESLAEEYADDTGDDISLEDFAYQPSGKFITFLKQNGYDGFENDDGDKRMFLIFDAKNILKA